MQMTSKLAMVPPSSRMQVNAAAYLSNRILQERNGPDGYDGIYSISQAMARSAMNAIEADVASGRN